MTSVSQCSHWPQLYINCEVTAYILPSCRAVVLIFGFAVIILILSSVPFFLGANMLKVCYSIAEDPPNDLPSYELYSRVIDNV